MEKFTDLEQKINVGIDLLEIAKTYCEYNYDKSAEISALVSVLEVVLANQKNIINQLDTLIVG